VLPKNIALDVGSGTGQAAIALCKHFSKVIALDPSPGQIQQLKENKEKPGNLECVEGTAETIQLPDKSVDLITVAQAIHWFDLPRFFTQTHRLLKHGGLVAIWGYSLCKIDNEKADEVLRKFYVDTIGPYWDPQRKHIDNHYKDIIPENYDYPGKAIERVDLQMTKPVDLASFMGYMETWSAVNQYKTKHPDLPSPLIQFKSSLEQCLIGKGTMNLTFPIFMILAKEQ